MLQHTYVDLFASNDKATGYFLQKIADLVGDKKCADRYALGLHAEARSPRLIKAADTQLSEQPARAAARDDDSSAC